MIVLLALLSAFVFGSGVVVQQRAAMGEPAELAGRPGLIVRLMHRPIWVVGLGADIVGFALQAAALQQGSLVVVQPLITTSLLFALILASAWYREPISVGEWGAVVLVLGGLSVFLIVASPGEQSSAAGDLRGWLLCSAVVTLVACLAVAAGLSATGRARAALLGVSAGIADAFMAVLAKAFAGSFDHGVAAVFRSWTPYALVVAGGAAILLVTTAYQAGHATVSLPIITVTDPLVGALIGITLFGEHLALGGARGPVVTLALLAMAGGLVALGRDRRLTAAIVEEPSRATFGGPT